VATPLVPQYIPDNRPLHPGRHVDRRRRGAGWDCRQQIVTASRTPELLSAPVNCRGPLGDPRRLHRKPSGITLRLTASGWRKFAPTAPSHSFKAQTRWSNVGRGRPARDTMDPTETVGVHGTAFHVERRPLRHGPSQHRHRTPAFGERSVLDSPPGLIGLNVGLTAGYSAPTFPISRTVALPHSGCVDAAAAGRSPVRPSDVSRRQIASTLFKGRQQ
jgi:hypothetical protein